MVNLLQRLYQAAAQCLRALTPTVQRTISLPTGETVHVYVPLGTKVGIIEPSPPSPSDDGYDYDREYMRRMYGRLVVPVTLDEWKGIRPECYVILTDVYSQKRDLPPEEVARLNAVAQRNGFFADLTQEREGTPVEPLERIPLLEELIGGLGFQRTRPRATELLGWYEFVRGNEDSSDYDWVWYQPLPLVPTGNDRKGYDDSLRTEITVCEGQPSDTLYTIAKTLLDHGHRVAMPPVDRFQTHTVYYKREGDLYVLDRVVEMPELAQKGGYARNAIIKGIAGDKYLVASPVSTPVTSAAPA